MVIERADIDHDILLLDEELKEAYDEYQYELDRENIIDVIAGTVDGSSFSARKKDKLKKLSKNSKFIESCIDLSRRYACASDVINDELWACAMSAVENVLDNWDEEAV